MKKSIALLLVFVLQANYGYGWVDLCEYSKNDLDELSADLLAYCENEPLYAHRVVTVLRKDGE